MKTIDVPFLPDDLVRVMPQDDASAQINQLTDWEGIVASLWIIGKSEMQATVSFGAKGFWTIPTHHLV